MKKALRFLYILIFMKTAVAQLGSPVLIEPPTKDAAVSVTTTLDWSDVPGADYFEVQISALDNFSDIIGQTLTPDNTSSYAIPTGTIVPFTKYYWRIRAINITETGPWSDIWEFTTIGTSVQEISSLEGEVTTLAANNILPQNQATLLIARLEAAEARINNNQNTLAILNLYMFKLRVFGLSVFNILPNLEGQILNKHADRIIALIQGDNIPELTKNEAGLLNRFSLAQNYPNPFNPITTIEFTIPKASLVTLKIYDVQGREITTLVNEYKEAGLYILNWNASGYSSGVYFYRLNAENFTETKRMILNK